MWNCTAVFEVVMFAEKCSWGEETKKGELGDVGEMFRRLAKKGLANNLPKTIQCFPSITQHHHELLAAGNTRYICTRSATYLCWPHCKRKSHGSFEGSLDSMKHSSCLRAEHAPQLGVVSCL